MQKYRISFKFLSAALILLIAFPYIFSVKAHGAPKKKFTVVIDAGHGGKDYGAMENGYNEKDINLAVALKLGEMIQKKLKDTQVIYTRSTDEFISLQKRADIANKGKADLFISLHCNSVDKSNTNRANIMGATTYVMGHNKDNENLSVAQRENSVVELDADDSSHYSQFDPSQDDSFIIYKMTQNKNHHNSLIFANNVQKEMSAIGRKDLRVKEAGFWVLWSTAMPSALIEMDFICNPEQAKFLGSKEGQEKIAGAVFNAVKSYESYYRKNLGSVASNDSDEIDVKVVESNPYAQGSEFTDASGPTATEVAELPQSKSKKKYSSPKEDSQRRRAATSGHHRRPKAAREEGSSYVAQTVMPIISETEPQVMTQTQPAPAQQQPEASKADKKSTKKSSKKDNKTAVAQQPNKSKSAKKKASKQNISMMYRIVLLTTSEELNADAKEFKGLSPIKAIKENNIYKYTYGESESKEQMEGILQEIISLFPEAYVIRVFN